MKLFVLTGTINKNGCLVTPDGRSFYLYNFNQFSINKHGLFLVKYVFGDVYVCYKELILEQPGGYNRGPIPLYSTKIWTLSKALVVKLESYKILYFKCKS